MEPPSDNISRSRQQRRNLRRSRVLLGGKLVFGQSEYTADCVIRDLTLTGARVRLSAAVMVHDPIWLINFNTGRAHKATIAWRSPREFGLTFEQSIELDLFDSGPLNHLRRIWLDSGGGRGGQRQHSAPSTVVEFADGKAISQANAPSVDLT